MALRLTVSFNPLMFQEVMLIPTAIGKTTCKWVGPPLWGAESFHIQFVGSFQVKTRVDREKVKAHQHKYVDIACTLQCSRIQKQQKKKLRKKNLYIKKSQNPGTKIIIVNISRRLVHRG